MPKGQACCGIPAISGGDMETCRELVQHNVALFDGNQFDYVITACATCAFTIRKIWPLVAQNNFGPLAEKSRQMAAKTMDISEFISSRFAVQSTSNTTTDASRITYHDPCHLKKSLGVAAEPRNLVACNPNRHLIEMSDADVCCGMGGSFNLAHYDLSREIGQRKSNNIAATGCQTVATGCPACMMQLADALTKAGENIAVKHVIEIYAEEL